MLIRLQTIAANQRPESAGMTHDIIIVNIIVKARINPIEEGTILLNLIHQKRRGIHNQFFCIFSINRFCPAPVIQRICAQRKDLVILIANPSPALEYGINFRQLFERIPS